MRQAGLFWFFVGAATGTGLLVVGLPLLVIAVVLFRRPRGHRPVLRRSLASLLLLVDGAMLVVTLAAFFVPQLCDSILRGYLQYSQTYHLTAPRVLAGVRFPAGSTVFMDGDDIDHGDVPVPTVIAGVPLVGEFVANHEVVGLGTLAAPAEVRGVPCGSGRVSFSTGGSISCILSREFSFVGHALAPGQPISISSIEGYGRWLEEGTLARPERLFDVLWPTGSILSGIQDETARPEGSPGLPDLRAEVCLLSDEAVPIPGATLHGTLTYSVLGEKRWVASGCGHLDEKDRAGSREGYAEVGRHRFVQGQRSSGKSSWSWGDDGSNGSDETR